MRRVLEDVRSWQRSALISVVLFVGLGISAAAPCLAQADTAFPGLAQQMLDAKVVELDLVGVSVAIAKDGVLVWEGGAGLRDRERNLPAGPDMVHRIASITKAMTATAVMQLVESGEVDLEGPLQDYVPSFPESDKGVLRIHHLLNHTSGIRHYFGRENRPTERYESLQEAMQVFQDRELWFPPGEKFLYTTYGYTVLGAVIESASGRSYEDYMQEHVFVPAGMTHTGLERLEEDVPNRSELYRRDKENGLVEDLKTDLSVKYPGGGVSSTAGDLVRFGIAFSEGRLVRAETVEEMLIEPQVESRRSVPYGFGWMFWDDENLGRILHQDGGQSGTSTVLRIYRDRSIVVAVLGNVARTGGEIGQIQKALVDLLIERGP